MWIQMQLSSDHDPVQAFLLYVIKRFEYCLWELSIPNGECHCCLLSYASCIPRVKLSIFQWVGWGAGELK